MKPVLLSLLVHYSINDKSYSLLYYKIGFILSDLADCRFPGGASSKEAACQCRRLRDASLIPGLGRSPRGGRSNPLQYSCLENPMDNGAAQATVFRVAELDTT